MSDVIHHLSPTDISGKGNGVAGITPPASEVGNDEILARTLENTDNDNKKRKSRVSDESSPKAKRPRRTLINDYFTKNEDNEKSPKQDEEEEDEEEEEEFEVGSIINMKRSQVGALTF